jgi:single-strand DNA-binding protein
MSVNKVILLGRVGKDPEVREVNDTKVAKLSLATSEKFTKKDGEKVENTAWHSLVMWGRLAEIAEKYITKGDMLYVEGKIDYRKYEKDGSVTYYTDIVVTGMNMVSSKNEVRSRDNEKIQESKTEELPEDDLPF